MHVIPLDALLARWNLDYIGVFTLSLFLYIRQISIGEVLFMKKTTYKDLIYKLNKELVVTVMNTWCLKNQLTVH